MVPLADKGKKDSLVSAAVDLLSVLFFLYILSSVSGQLSERRNLLELKKSISDPYGILNSWNAGSFNHCSWFGVSCNSDFRVSGLRIGGNFSLAHSCSLKSELALHDFGTGKNCSFSSVINGRLGGRISSVIEKLTDLRVLSLPFNEFDGEIPVEIWGLKNLEVLDLEGNVFSGCFSCYDFSGLKKLRVLNLAFNRISGLFSHSLSKCKGLRILNLAGNRINDVIPGFVGHFRKLRVVNLSFNRLVGYIPNDLGYDCGNLEHLDLSGNLLKGGIPRALGNCGRLRTLLLSSNALRGVIPNELGNLQRLEVLDVSRNRLSGPLPANLGNCIGLSVLVLTTHFNVPPMKRCPRVGVSLDDHNSFEGPIPDEITMLPELKIMWAPGASLKGNIPSNWGSCKSLMMVNLAQNHFTGEISGLFTGCTELKYLNLSSNKLTGTLDGNLRLSCIAMFNSGGNLLSGPIPDFDANVCPHLPSTGKQLVSPYDPSIAYFSFFSYELLSESTFPRTRPSVIHDFSGELPLLPFTPDGCEEEMEYTFLAGGNNGGSLALDVSKDRISESIPWDDTPTPPQSSQSNKHRKITLILACVIGGPAVAVSLILLAYFCYVKKGAETSTSEISVTPEAKRITLLEDVGVPLTYDSIVEATENFSQRNCIGNGGFGYTYKAELAPGNIVAVKRLTAERHQGAAQFHAEISTLGGIRHPNIITLIGYYAKDAEMFLIYNFLPGGNLDQFIRHRSRRVFNFDILLKIALHVASALSFLHEQCTPRIVHRDVKPSNILLDGENNAFLSDFGLSKIMAPTETYAYTRVAGTYGYIAPEYALNGRVSNKADVYSYGVVLLELMSDKRVLDPSFYLHEDGYNIVSWALSLKHGQVQEFFTASLWETGPRDKLMKMLNMSMLCTLETVSARPSMRQVVRKLKELQHPPS
ncbi:hypothetical protein ACS0TY_009875 [Phlomoides rotata]